MPLPKPSKGERGDDFVDRCMSNPTMLEEYPDAAQRSAVCHAQVDTKKASYERTRLDERRRKRRRKWDETPSYASEVEKDGYPALPWDMNDLREFRANRRRNRRRERLGLYPVYSCDVYRADISQADIAAAGKLTDEQGPEFSRKRRGDALRFAGFGKTDEKVPDAGMIVPAELTGDAEMARRKAQDALRALFSADLAKIDDAARTFTESELVNLAKGGKVDPEALRELYRVAKAVSLMVTVPHPLAKSEEPDEPARVDLRKFDDELQIVWGEVYVPMIPDTDGDVMTAEEIRKAAYNFAGRMRLDQIDQMHDQDACGAYVVESFIARKGDPIFIEDSWVIGVHIPNKEIWKKVKDGTYNGFSLEGKAMRVEKQFEMEIPDRLTGRTSTENGHSHEFSVRFSDQGEFLGGWTSEDYDNSSDSPDWHNHQISRGTVVNPGGANSHHHRYSISEAILEVSTGRRPPKGDEISQVGYATEG